MTPNEYSYYHCTILLIGLDENTLAENMSYKRYISKMFNNNSLHEAKKFHIDTWTQYLIKKVYVT